jgi:dTDP-4-amino-4,6-dideoxygalactose transaminase
VNAEEPPVRFVDLGRQYASIKDEIDTAVLEAIASTEYVLGDQLAVFEREFASYCGAAHCVGVGSGAAAIQLALEALGVERGDEVIAPANTFFGTVMPVLRIGATPVLVDCDPETATISPDAVAAAIGPRTRAVLAVHLYGHPADVDPLQELCSRHGITLVEDACQSHGARYNLRRAGSLGDVAAFSFYPSKNLGAYGDGGAITTNDPDLAERIRVLRNVGQAATYTHVTVGANERLDTLQAAVLRVKLRYLDRWNRLRRSHAAAYEDALSPTDVQTPRSAAWAEHAWHLYVVRTERREHLREVLRARGVATGLHYPLPLHLQPALSGLGHRRGDFPVTEAWADELLSLPMFPELDRSEIERVTQTIREWHERT